jgi:Cu(I)/Ag(I) efflux system membrane protein CusA/SilA
VFWYTLEGRDEEGQPAGGWDLNELRSTQDWFVRYQLQGTRGVSEVASIGGFVQEYQIDVDPDAMRAFNVKLTDVYGAVKMANLDVGARSIEVNNVEYLVRGLGFVKSVADLENTVVKVNDNVPVYIRNIAKVQLGPALRRGALDKGGVEAVGGVVVELLGGCDLGRHVGEQVAHRLMLPDRHPERLAFSGIPKCVVERRSRNADRTTGDLDSADLESGHHLRETQALTLSEE